MENTFMMPKILVVDDEPDLEMLIKQKFRKEIKEGRYDFSFAHNGVEALKELNNNKGIELMLTDINMPEMDGLTLLSKVKELNNPLLHSVIVSAYGDIFNIRTAMNGGAFDFVVKPIDLNDLDITIKKALDNLNVLKKALQTREKLLVVQNELEEARELQLSMLPKELPKISNLDFAVHMETASEVGGDYYDFSFKADESINIAIGDATGHGMRAGTMVSVMKALFTSNSSEMSMEEFFNSSNKTIKQINFQRLMMAFAMLNIQNNRVKYINAGMPSLYLYKKSEDKVYEYGSQAMPLGAMNISNYTHSDFEIQKGDTILMLSDAFAELLNNDNQQYGYERVVENFKKYVNNSPSDIIEAFKQEASNWVMEKEIDDDVTFVVIKVN